MEARYNCCKAIQKALMSSSKVTSDPSLAAIAEKVSFKEYLLFSLFYVLLFPKACLVRRGENRRMIFI